jgi:molybdopterin synthase catalytic subunit
LKIQEAKGSLTNNSKVTKQQFTVKETSDPKTVFDGTFTAKKQDTRLNNVTIIHSTGNLADADNVTFHVYIDGDEVATFD